MNKKGCKGYVKISEYIKQNELKKDTIKIEIENYKTKFALGNNKKARVRCFRRKKILLRRQKMYSEFNKTHNSKPLNPKKIIKNVLSEVILDTSLKEIISYTNI